MEELNKLDKQKKDYEAEFKQSNEKCEKIKIRMEEILESIENFKKILKDIEVDQKEKQKMIKKSKSAEENLQKKYENEVKNRDEMSQKIIVLEQNPDPVVAKKEKDKLIDKLNKIKEKEDEEKQKYDQCMQNSIALENDLVKIDAKYNETKKNISSNESEYASLEIMFKEILSNIEKLKVQIFETEKKYKEEFDKLMNNDNLELIVG